MISGPAARSLLTDVTALARVLVAEVELRCACRCRCHSPIGWAVDVAAPCSGTIDLERLDCAYSCRGDRGCELAPSIRPRLAHV